MDDNFVIEWFRSYFGKPHLNEITLKPVLHFRFFGIWGTKFE